MKKILLTILLAGVIISATAQETVTISGKVTDYAGNPVDSSLVEIKYSDFETAYETHTNINGEYSLTVKKGRYLALAAMRMDEYPKFSTKLKEEQRLEFWAWNVVADKNMQIDIRYNRLEVYGINAFKIEGSYPGYMVYFRPMSLTKFQASLEDASTDITVKKDKLEVNVYLDGKEMKINTIERVSEYVGGDDFFGYLMHVNIPRDLTNNPYRMLKIVAKDLENEDKGEAIYFLENFFHENNPKKK